jgi:UDP-N-acetylglucosamine--dolichyl-phosphate N-acetylglucosaminephosphotransferase
VGTLILVSFLCAAVVSLFSFPLVIPRLKRAGIVGKDMNKPGQPEVAEMGGLVTAAGFSAGILLIVALKTFTQQFNAINLQYLLAALSTVLTAVLTGIFDDFVSLKQWAKTILPMFSALPLIAAKAGDTTIIIPFVGQMNFGIIYSLVFVPIGVAIAANGVNMLAGFNGLEVGMGLVGMTSLAIIAFHLGETTALVILLAALGALLATLRYNWYPARVFIGDAGTFSIGAIMASAVIIGNFEMAGVIIMIPYALDFFIKAKNRFPSRGWEGEYREGKLYCPEKGARGLAQLIMRMTGGISEKNLTLILIGVEVICGAGAIWMFIQH